MPTSFARDRVILGTAVVATAILFSARLEDPVNVIKMTALVLCAIGLLASVAVRAVATRTLQVPWGLPALAGVLLLMAFVVVAMASPVWNTALLGTYGRNSGLLTYAAALVLFLVGLQVLDRDGTRVILYALMLAGGFTASYGLLQHSGVDPVAWNNPFNPIIGAMGNPNFAAAYVAICSPAAAWGAVRTGWAIPWRVLSGLVLLLCLTAALLSGSAQGPLAAAPGLAVLALAWLLDHSGQGRKLGLVALATLSACSAFLLAAGAAGTGPAAGVFADAGSRARGWYWEAALAMWREHRFLGVGLDTFGPYWRLERSPESVQALGADAFTDAAHSVPLHLLATGGLVLALAYAALVVITTAALVRGLRRLRGQERLLLGALGGCWVAYQVQSLVSIDQVPLIVAQYVLAAGVLVTAGWARLREVRLPGSPAPVPSTRRRPGSPPPSRKVGTVDAVAFAAIALLAATLAWLALTPLRASAAVLAGDRTASRGDILAGLAAYERATELLPAESRYWRRTGQLHQAAGKPAQAQEALRRAVQADPLDIDAVRRAANLAEEQGQADEARRLRKRLLRLDPATG